MFDLTTKTENDRKLAEIAKTVAASLNREIPENYPHRATIATLGHGASVHLTISLDPRNTWENGIMENSRYARFSWDTQTSKLEMFSGGYKCAKFRKCTVKGDSAEGIKQKIQDWITASNALAHFPLTIP